jgi:hypothetical protein
MSLIAIFDQWSPLHNLWGSSSIFPLVSGQEFKPSPLTYKGAMRATVDKVLITSSESDNFIIKVSQACITKRIRQVTPSDLFGEWCTSLAKGVDAAGSSTRSW